MLHLLNRLYPIRYTAFGVNVALLVWCGITIGSNWAAPAVPGMGGAARRLGRSPAWGCAMSPKPSAPCGATTPLLVTSGSCWKKSDPKSASTSLRAIPRPRRFRARNAAWCTPAPKAKPTSAPFGTQLDVRAPGYEWINHSMAPTVVAGHDFRIAIGGPSCMQPYSASVFNISARLRRTECQRHPGAQCRGQAGRVCA